MGHGFVLKNVGKNQPAHDYPSEILLSDLEATVFKRSYTGPDGGFYTDRISLKSVLMEPQGSCVMADVGAGYFKVDTRGVTRTRMFEGEWNFLYLGDRLYMGAGVIYQIQENS